MTKSYHDNDIETYPMEPTPVLKPTHGGDAHAMLLEQRLDIQKELNEKEKALLAEPKSALAVQEGGDHYKNMAIQPIEFIHANGIPFAEGSVIKYITRHRNKNKEQDIRKAIHFCKLILKLEYGIDE